MVAPLYISEISPPEIRGALLVLEEFSIVLGIVIAFWITYGTQFIETEWSWRLPFLLQMIPGCILGAGIIFLPFSPRWLLAKGRRREALQALRRLRRVDEVDPRVVAECWDIEVEVRLQQDLLKDQHPKYFDTAGRIIKGLRLEIATWGDLFLPKCWRRTLAGTSLAFLQQFVRSSDFCVAIFAEFSDH